MPLIFLLNVKCPFKASKTYSYQFPKLGVRLTFIIVAHVLTIENSEKHVNKVSMGYSMIPRFKYDLAMVSMNRYLYKKHHRSKMLPYSKFGLVS